MGYKRVIVFFLIIILLLLIGYLFPYFTGNFVKEDSGVIKKEIGIVTKIVDGDTIHVKLDEKDKEETIRLLGINTPEKKKPYYEEAKQFLAHEIENKRIELIMDKEDVDRYGRKLRYVFYNNRLINIEIIENGLATTFMLDELRYKDKFVNAEKFAIMNEKGLWKKSNDKCSSCIKLIKLESDSDYFIIKNSCDFYCNLSGWIVKDDANHFFVINSLDSFEEAKYDSIELFKSEIWNDNHDRFFMRDATGDLVVFYEY